MKWWLVLLSLFCQDKGAFAQQKNKLLPRVVFCGYKYREAAMIRSHMQEQLDFLRISPGDTVVDIGSSSGAYVGAFNVIMEAKDVHFILVDIDTACLNQQRLRNMIIHYEAVKGKPLGNTFSIVNNSPDSLHLKKEGYSKLLLMNTLHEIPDRLSFIQQMAGVLRKGGELFVAELMPTEKNKKHFGCHHPLVSESDLKKELATAGFVCSDILINPGALKRKRNPYYFFRFVKE